MHTFYCHTETAYFAQDCTAVNAVSAPAAAEIFAGELFDDGADWMRPVEVIVAETREGANAARFVVEREQIIRDEAREIGEVVIEASDDDTDDE